MPNRILRDWTNSKKMGNLSSDAERLFVRLIMKVDDFGRFYGNPVTIKNVCFPHSDKVTVGKVSKWLEELKEVVRFYSVDGEIFIEILDFKQRLRNMTVKFPIPKDLENNEVSPTLTDIDMTGRGHRTANLPSETKQNRNETETKVITSVSDLQVFDEWIQKMLTDEFWLANTAKTLSRPYEYVIYNLKDKWKSHLISYHKKPKDYEDFTTHFVNWLRNKKDDQNTTFNDISSMPVNY